MKWILTCCCFCAMSYISQQMANQSHLLEMKQWFPTLVSSGKNKCPRIHSFLGCFGFFHFTIFCTIYNFSLQLYNFTMFLCQNVLVTIILDAIIRLTNFLNCIFKHATVKKDDNMFYFWTNLACLCLCVDNGNAFFSRRVKLFLKKKQLFPRRG